MHWRQGWWLGSKRTFQPRLDPLVSGEHCTPFHTPSQPSCQTDSPQSALSQQQQAVAGTMPTLHICSHGTTVALQCQHTDNPEHSLHALLPAIMQPVMPIRVQPGTATSHDLPSPTFDNMSVSMPLPAVRHRKGCTCLFSMIQSATGSKLHPFPSWQLLLIRLTNQVRQIAADRQTSRFGPPHNHHSTKHCTTCTQPIQNGPEPRAHLMQLEPPASTQHTTFSASSFITCYMPLHAPCLLPPCLAMLVGPSHPTWPPSSMLLVHSYKQNLPLHCYHCHPMMPWLPVGST